MPTRPEWRHFYRGPTWEATRARILARAKGCCEDCGVPNHTRVARAAGWWMIPPALWWAARWQPPGMPGVIWHAPGRKTVYKGDNFPREICREVYIVLTMSHLDHTPGHDDDENLRARCQWCHLNYDARFHRQTRMEHKDARRPLLQEARA